MQHIVVTADVVIIIMNNKDIELFPCLWRRLSSAGNRCKRFGTRSGPIKRRSRSRSKPFATLNVSKKDFFEFFFFKKSVDDRKAL